MNLKLLSIWQIASFIAFEGQRTEVKGIGKTTQLFGDLRNIKRYWELKKEAEDRNRWKRQFESNIRESTSIFQ